MMDSTKKKLVAVLETVDCQGHLAEVNKKDRTLICNRYLYHIKEIYPSKKLSDIAMFNGALNV